VPIKKQNGLTCNLSQARRSDIEHQRDCKGTALLPCGLRREVGILLDGEHETERASALTLLDEVPPKFGAAL
jgi:hypothetical protein